MSTDAKDTSNDDGEVVGADADDWMESPEAKAHPSLVRNIATENGDVAAFSNNDGESLVHTAEESGEDQDHGEK